MHVASSLRLLHCSYYVCPQVVELLSHFTGAWQGSTCCSALECNNCNVINMVAALYEAFVKHAIMLWEMPDLKTTSVFCSVK